jgi:ATP-dependent DNA helicase RecG
MIESHNIEFKATWKDEFLKWICGFANANGGVIYIGIDDAGIVSGLKDAKRLMEEIPNKTRDVLGILVDVNLHQGENGQFIEVIIAAHLHPVSYKGQYHYRSGTTKQELKGASLDRFLLSKKGKRWDGVPIPNVSTQDLKKDTLAFFCNKAMKSQRIQADVSADEAEYLLDNLHLREGGDLKRAAILLFHPNPELFVTGAYVKIGFFESDSDLRFQDEIHGNLFDQIERTVELLFTKYLKAVISYEGINRVETFEFPKDAVREALLNAIAHKDYSSGVPIQLSVYRDKLIIWNDGELPEDWTVESLMKKHASKPFNPDIANALFRSGYIEAWGRGILKMSEECLECGLPLPLIYFQHSGFWVVFRKDILNADYLQSLHLNERQIKAVLYVKENGVITNSIYQEMNATKQTLSSQELRELVEKGILKASGSKGRGAKYLLAGIVR